MSTIDNLDAHTPMMQQYHFLLFKLLKYKHKIIQTLVLVY